MGDSPSNPSFRAGERPPIATVDVLRPSSVRQETGTGYEVVRERAVAGRIDDGLRQRAVVAAAELICARIAGVTPVGVQRLRGAADRQGRACQKGGQQPRQSAKRYLFKREPREGGGIWNAFSSLSSHLPGCC